MDSVPVDSVPVIPWPFQNLPEFHGMEITILAGSTAKIPFRGIPGIIQIPADSGRNTWGTVKNSNHIILKGIDLPNIKYIAAWMLNDFHNDQCIYVQFNAMNIEQQCVDATNPD